MSQLLRPFKGIIRNARRTVANSAGVTLTELMVAAVILTTAVIGLMGAFLGIQRAIQVSKSKTLASGLAQEKIQILKQKNYYQVLVTPNPSYVTSYSPNIPYDATYFPPETILEGSVTYTRLTYIQVAEEDSGSIVVLPPTTPDTGMRLITVSVLWTESGLQKKLVVNSVLANPNTVMSNSVIQGTVQNAVTLAPIKGALVNLAENVGWRDTTDASGNFKINVSPGSFRMVVSAPGYFGASLQTSIAANTITTVPTFNLQPMSSGTVSGTVWVNSHLIVSQVVADTYTFCGDGNQHDVEYIEIFNPTPTAQSLGSTGVPWWSKPTSLWYWSENGTYAGEYNYDAGYSFNLQYLNTTIPAYSYFLISNADRFMINGVWVTADATYHPLYTQYLSQYANKAGYVGLVSYLGSAPWWSSVDTVRWDSATSGVNGAPYWGTTVSTVSIPNCCGNTALGSPKGNQAVRISSPTASVASMLSYGHAYNAGNNQLDFLYPSAGFSGIQYQPHNVSSGAFTVVAGAPAVGAVITANDGLSDPATAYAYGSPPVAKFLMNNVATATVSAPWTVLITSGGYTLENDTVTVPTTGSNYDFPSSTTILNQTATSGFIAGSVLDVSGNPITNPSLIVVSPGANGANANANGTNGRYLLRVSTGLVDVVANPNYANNNYVSISSLSISVALGQISDGVNFTLSQGGSISGFVTRDGINALPGITVTAFDSYGYARDTQVTNNNGTFTTLTIATGTYTVSPNLDSLENSSPVNASVTVVGGATTFSSTFTISGALGTLSGSVTASGRPISTGVLIVVTTSTLSGSPPAPPALSSNTLVGIPYYVTSSREDGTYSVDVRQSTSPAYRIYGYYTTLSSTGAVTTQSLTLTNVQVVAGSSVTGNNFAW